MTPDFVLSFSKDAMQTVALVSAPILLAGLVIGLIVSIFQTVTQIQEVTLTFVPKLIAMGAITYLFGGWMMRMIMEFTRHTFTLAAGMGG